MMARLPMTSIRTLSIALVAGTTAWWTGSMLPGSAGRASGQQGTPSGIWRHIGPTPIIPGWGPKTADRHNSGRVISIAADPGNQNRWLAGTATGGIWTTTDAGQTWTSNTDSLPSLAIGAIAFAPGNPSIVYAGTGEGNFSVDGRVGVGMLKSVDGGTSWNLLPASSFERAAVAAIRVHPADANIVLAATARGFGNGRFSEFALATRPPFGVLRSVDGGMSWTRTLPGQATAIEIASDNFNHQYAAIGDPNAGQISDSPGSRGNGLYRSTDGGQNWSEIAGPWSALRPGRVVPALAPSNPSVLYVSVSGLVGSVDANRVVGLWRTDNAWSPTPNWTQIPTDATGPQGYCSAQCTNAHVLNVDPSDADTLFAGGRESLWRCRNCSASPIWKSSLQVMHPDHRALAWAGNRLLDGNDGGVASTIDRGDTWQVHNTTFAITQLFSGALQPTNPRIVLPGSTDNGCLPWSGEPAWTGFRAPQAHGTCEGAVALSSRNPDTDWMAAAAFGEINRTLDGGVTFTRVTGGITEPVAAVTADVRQCPTKDDVFLTGNRRLWRTNDFFSAPNPTWSVNGPENAGDVRAIAFAASDPDCNTYAFGSKAINPNEGRIWLTTDGGRNWKNIASGDLPSRTVNSLAFNPRDPNTLYAAYSNFDVDGRSRHVFKTTNAQAASPAWTNVSPPENRPQNVILVDPENPSIVYVGAEAGIWRSTDGAATWNHLGPEVGIPNVPVHDLKIHPLTRELYAFTFGRGVFVRSP